MFLSWVDDLGDKVVPAMTDLLRSALYFICKLVYDIIITLYDSFKIVSGAKVIDTSVLEQIANRIGLLAGIIMFFLVAFSFVQYILDPDKVSDKEMGGATLVKKIIIVIILLGTSTYIFKTLDSLQDTILNGQIVEKIMLPTSIELDEDNIGKRLSVELFSAFYRYNEKTYIGNDDADNPCKGEIEGTINDASYVGSYVQETGHFPDDLSPLNNCLLGRVEVNGDVERYSDFNGLVALLVGLGAGYFLIMYTISVGIRVVQLAFLQIMSPAAIIGYLEPKKDNMFSKWLKIYISTYIDVFVRIAIINLCVFLIAVIIEGFSGGSSDLASTFYTSINPEGGSKPGIYIMIIMIIAVLSFAKKAPELLKEILPSGNASKIGFGASMKDAVGLTAIAGGTAGAIGGALGGAIGSIAGGNIIGAASGFLKGGLGGIKSRKLGDVIKNSKGGFDSQRSAALRTQQRIAEGGSRFISPFNQNRLNQFESQLERYNSQIGYFDAAEKEAESKAIKNGSNYISSSGNSLALLEKLRNDQTLSSQQRQQYEQEYKDTLDAAKKFNLNYGLNVKKGQVWFNDTGAVDELSINGTDYTGGEIANHIVELGDNNNVINANLNAMGAGQAGDGRYDRADGITTSNKNARTQIQTSAEYNRLKTNAKYSGKK